MRKTGKGGRQRRLDQMRRGGSAAGAGNRRQFEMLVAQALEQIPEPFKSKLENVAVVIEERPDRELLASLGMRPDEDLLGLYDGIPLTERGDWYNLAAPDRIIIFRRPILAICTTSEEIRAEVRQTVLHEVAHFYGIDDEELDRMGFS